MDFNYSSDTSFDKDFNSLRLNHIISFYPWIGKNYKNSRVAIVGKFHQTASDGSGAADENTPEYTREIVFNEGIRKVPQKNIFFNIFSMIYPSQALDYDSRKRFFDQIAFFNLSRKQGTKIIAQDEFIAFKEISKIIKLERCLFMGISLDYAPVFGQTNENLLNALKINVSGKTVQNLSQVKFETATLSFNGISINSVFCEKPVLDENFGYYFPIVV